MAELPINVCRADTPERPKDYVTCLSHELVFQHGLPTEAIIGVLVRPTESSVAIDPSVFAQNRAFVDFMHSVVARRGPDMPGLIAEAKRQGEGWVYVIDQRTPTPQSAVPPEDIVGVFEIKSSRVVSGSYQANAKHLILSAHGFVRLGSELQSCLLEELAAVAGRGKL